MSWTNTVLILTIIVTVISDHAAYCQRDLIIKNENQSDRLPRKATPPDTFENFFLKAAKQVPRIGRRNFEQNEQYLKDNARWNNGYFLKMAPPKRFDAGKEMPWADLADRVEYYPEIMMSPALLATASLKEMENYGYDIPEKRSITMKNKEIPEIRFQPNV